jgi:flagellar biosynthesis protein FlhG
MSEQALIIEPAKLQFLERVLDDLKLPEAARPRALVRAHRRLFIDGAPVSSVLAELSRECRGARIIAVTSGKGGVGKTTVSVNLAIAFANCGQRVLLFDADFGMANVHVFSGIVPSATVLDFVDGRRRLDEVVTPGPAGIGIVCGPSGVGRIAEMTPTAREALGRELLRVAAGYDVVLVDTGAGIAPAVLHFLGLAGETIVVSTPNIAATLDAYGLIKVAHESRLKTEFHLLVNLADDEHQAIAVQDRIAGCAARFLQRDVRGLGFLRRDSAVEAANQRRCPLLLDQPGHANSQTLSRIAASFQIPGAIAPARSAA